MPRPTKKLVRNSAPLVAVLEQLVVPAFEENVAPGADGPAFKLVEPEADSAEAPHVHGRLCGQHLVHVSATPCP